MMRPTLSDLVEAGLTDERQQSLALLGLCAMQALRSAVAPDCQAAFPSHREMAVMVDQRSRSQ